MPEIVMPRLSDSMNDGKVLRWCVAEGARVAAGDIIAEVETDKANMEVEMVEDGVISQLLAKPGDVVAVGSAIARFDPASPGGERSDLLSGLSSEPPYPASGLARDNEDELNASPLAIRIAEEHGIDLRDVKGTGVNGRIMKEDVLNAITRRPAREEPVPEFAPEPVSPPMKTDKPPTSVSYRIRIGGLRDSVPALCHRIGFPPEDAGVVLAALEVKAAMQCMRKHRLAGLKPVVLYRRYVSGLWMGTGTLDSNAASLQDIFTALKETREFRSQPGSLVITDLTAIGVSEARYNPSADAELTLCSSKQGRAAALEASLSLPSGDPLEAIAFMEEFTAVLENPILFMLG